MIWKNQKNDLIYLNIFYGREKQEYILRKYNEIWSRLKNSIGKGSNFEVVHNDKYLTRTSSKNDKIRTDFHDEGLPPEKTKSFANSIIFIDSVYRSDKRYDPEALVE